MASRKDDAIRVRVTRAQKVRLQRIADRSGQTLASWVRAAALQAADKAEAR